MCWWSTGTVAQRREHLFHHCRWWRDQQNALWEAVGKVKDWKGEGLESRQMPTGAGLQAVFHGKV